MSLNEIGFWYIIEYYINTILFVYFSNKIFFDITLRRKNVTENTLAYWFNYFIFFYWFIKWLIVQFSINFFLILNIKF